MESLALPLVESSQVGEARRQGLDLAQRASFDEGQKGKLALILTELGNNLVRHARGGELILRRLAIQDRLGMEVVAIDRGPGITDVTRSLADGFSTGGTAGTGLGAIRRLSDGFDIFSLPESGTVIAARLWASAQPAPAPPPPLDIGAICVAKSGEECCGDGWAVSLTEGRVQVMVVDGLGHGPLAAAATHEALRVFDASLGKSPADRSARAPPRTLLQEIHGPLRSTRGAAGAVGSFDLGGDELTYAGIGNVSGVIADRNLGPSQRRSLVSLNGTLGHQFQRIQEFVYPFGPAATLVMASDGLATQWNLEAYPGIWSRSATVLAALLYRDYGRQRDDVTVLTLRRTATRGS